MYSMSYLKADARVNIGLLCNNEDNGIYTTWELYSDEIDLLDDYKFASEPTDEQIQEYVEGLFRSYTEGIMSNYSVSDMNMQIYTVEGLECEEITDLTWGKILELDVYIDEYELEYED